MAEAIPMTRAPKLRWSLRTMFVVVTAFGCWLGYEANWIRQRHAFIADEEAMGSPLSVWTGTHARAPGMLWVLGESGHSTLSIFVEDAQRRTEADEARIRLAQELFPEATVMLTYPATPPPN